MKSFRRRRGEGITTPVGNGGGDGGGGVMQEGVRGVTNDGRRGEKSRRAKKATLI